MHPFNFIPKAFLLVFSLLISSPVLGVTFTVSNLLDSGAGSLRTAINSANFAAGTDLIRFGVAGTINLSSPLPTISGRVIIDGSSAPGYVACNGPVVSINGAGAGAANGFTLIAGATGTTIRGLNIRGFSLNGIILTNSDANTISECYIGTNLAGTAASANGQNGIHLENGSDNNTIGGSGACTGNVISGNSGTGISLNSSNSNSISGNLVGTNAAGLSAIANVTSGILLANGSDNNTVGGSTINERNIVSGNGSGLTGNGISLENGTGNTISGNYVGLDINGTSAMGNAENGISLFQAPSNLVGGTGANEGNVVADHNFHAIVINGSCNDCEVYGNYCGTNANGDAPFPNDDSGVIVISSNDVIIGGNTAGHRNVLAASNSEYGVFLIQSQRTFVQGNYIGTNASATGGLPNALGGIRIDVNSDHSEIGGAGAGEANIIAYNNGFGVGVFPNTSIQNRISRNSMYCNTGKGIDLGGTGNLNWASPTIVTYDGSGASGTANGGDVIELFYDSLCTVPCQGKDYIATVVADGGGNWSYVGALNIGKTLVATATGVGPPPGNVDNTSEFTCQVALPVEYGFFKADIASDKKVELTWETTQETNSDRFVIERSQDSQRFIPVGEVKAMGFAQASKRYNFIDTPPNHGFQYYRLLQFDLDGTSSYSDIEMVYLVPPDQELEVWPIPANDHLFYHSTANEKEFSNLRLYNSIGQEVAGPDKVTYAGKGTWRLNLNGIPEGIYFLNIPGGGSPNTQEVVIKRN